MNNLPLKLGGRSNNCSRKSFNYPIHSLLHKCRNRDQGLKFSFFDTKFLLSFIPPLSQKRSLSFFQHPFRSCVLRRQHCIQYEVQCFPLGGKCRTKWNLFFGADQSGTGLGSLFWCNFCDKNLIKFLVLDDIVYWSILVKPLEYFGFTNWCSYSVSMLPHQQGLYWHLVE